MESICNLDSMEVQTESARHKASKQLLRLQQIPQGIQNVIDPLWVMSLCHFQEKGFK